MLDYDDGALFPCDCSVTLDRGSRLGDRRAFDPNADIKECLGLLEQRSFVQPSIPTDSFAIMQHFAVAAFRRYSARSVLESRELPEGSTSQTIHRANLGYLGHWVIV